jgi:hypothetical protein
MKKTILLSLIFSSVLLHGMNKADGNNEKIDIKEEKEMLKEAANKEIRKRIKYNAKALVLQERVRRLPGYEAFDVLKLINASNETTSPIETAQEKICHIQLSNPDYQEYAYDSDTQELIKNLAVINGHNLKLKAVIHEMENIFNYAETVSKLKKLETALDSQWRCNIV